MNFTKLFFALLVVVAVTSVNADDDSGSSENHSKHKSSENHSKNKSSEDDSKHKSSEDDSKHKSSEGSSAETSSEDDSSQGSSEECTEIQRKCCSNSLCSLLPNMPPVRGLCETVEKYVQGGEHGAVLSKNLLQNILILVKDIGTIIVNYLMHKPGFTVEDFSSQMNNPDINLGSVGLLTRYGYAVETHVIRTEDGYRLTVFRVLGKKNEPATGRKQPVIIQHGLLSSSDDFLVMGPERSLAYLLSDAGYDVWLTNARGNYYSRHHEFLSPDEPQFWDFSYHQLGVLDLPATIDYVLEKSSHQKVFYIGYTEGATVFFVLMSEKPEYNDKVIAMVALSPNADFAHQKSPLVAIGAPFVANLYPIAEIFGYNEVLARNGAGAEVIQDVCLADSFSQVKCTSTFYLIGGYDKTEMNKTMLPVILHHYPAGSSLKRIAHFGQNIATKKFRKFDFGSSGNKKIYGQSEPPNYKLSNVKVPVALFHSENDYLADPTDVQSLSQVLPNVIVDYKVPQQYFNHFDFAWGRDAPQLVHSKVIDVLFNLTIKV